MVRFGVIASYCTALVLFGIAGRVSVQGAATMLASFAILSFAGVVLLRQLIPTIESRLCILTFGPLSGWFSVVSAFASRGWRLVRRSRRRRWRTDYSLARRSFSRRFVREHYPSGVCKIRREVDWVFGMSAAVLAAMAICYWGVGGLTAKGYAFVPYFAWDFFNHISVCAEVSRQMPPQNSYFAGQPLHYYWFFHAWPAALINLAGVSAREAFVLSLPGTVLLFVGAFTGLIWSYESGDPAPLSCSRAGAVRL